MILQCRGMNLLYTDVGSLSNGRESTKQKSFTIVFLTLFNISQTVS